MSVSQSLVVNEIFYSIQGESTRCGMPCVFVRLTGCHLRCHYCDTEYAFHEGQRKSIEAVLSEVDRYPCRMVEVTGGEPLLQPNVHPFMTRLCDAGKTVLVETSGACDIEPCDPRVVRILDLKTPGSGEVDRNLWSNLDHITGRDEIKFVVCDRCDYEWARGLIRMHDLAHRVAAVLMSPASPMDPSEQIVGSTGLGLCELAEWILQDHLPVQLQTQLHKLIWDPMTRGV